MQQWLEQFFVTRSPRLRYLHSLATGTARTTPFRTQTTGVSTTSLCLRSGLSSPSFLHILDCFVAAHQTTAVSTSYLCLRSGLRSHSFLRMWDCFAAIISRLSLHCKWLIVRTNVQCCNENLWLDCAIRVVPRTPRAFVEFSI